MSTGDAFPNMKREVTSAPMTAVMSILCVRTACTSWVNAYSALSEIGD